jgi:hypothetical protein
VLVEFSAPPATGKSSVARALSEDGYKLFRRSVQGGASASGRSLFYVQLLFSPSFVYLFVRRFIFFVSNYKGHTLNRKLVSAFISAQTYVLKKRQSWYVRDQGYFQLGDWVPDRMRSNPAGLLKTLNDIGGTPTAVVFFDVPPHVVLQKLHRRGDIEKWENTAKSLGFNSALDRLVEQKKNDLVKYEVCRMGKIPYAVVKINDSEEIYDIDYQFSGPASDELNNQFYAFVESIKRHWLPFA